MRNRLKAASPRVRMLAYQAWASSRNMRSFPITQCTVCGSGIWLDKSRLVLSCSDGCRGPEMRGGAMPAAIGDRWSWRLALQEGARRAHEFPLQMPL